MIRVQASGTTLIGGTLPSAPNIQPECVGVNAEFAGTLEALTTGDYTSKSAFKLNSNGLIHCYRPTTSGALQQWFSGAPGGAQNDVITFDGGGSATFAGNIVAGSFDLGATDTNGVRLKAAGTIDVQRQSPADATAKAFRILTGNTETALINADGTVRIGGTLPSAPNISLNANGTIQTSPSGNVTAITVSTDNIDAAALRLNSTVSTDSSTAYAILVNDDNDPNSQKARINANGGAYFLETVGVGGHFRNIPSAQHQPECVGQRRVC